MRIDVYKRQPLLNSFRRQGQDNICTKGLWKRKHESCIYVKAGRWYRAVSYTHLDVYKRQALNKLLAFHNLEHTHITMDIAERELSNIITPDKPREITAQPVSYTHL